MTEWQPIETAPKDEWLLVAIEMPLEGGIQLFTARNGRWEYDGESGEFWEGPYADLSVCTLDLEPTHWMPLPEPPTA